jgi:hypothetical protein
LISGYERNNAALTQKVKVEARLAHQFAKKCGEYFFAGDFLGGDGLAQDCIKRT